MSDFDALLIAVTSGALAAGFLAMRGHLSLQLRRRPEPRKPAAPGES